MTLQGNHVTLSDIARRVGVTLSAVSNWRARHADFPGLVTGHDAVDVEEIARWLKMRRVPRNRLWPGEPSGTTYGDRFLRNNDDVAELEARTLDPVRLWSQTQWRVQLKHALETLCHVHDPDSSLELLLHLIYVKVMDRHAWKSLTSTTDWFEVRALLSRISLRAGTGEEYFVPIPWSVPNAHDQSVIDAIQIIDSIDMELSEGGCSVAARSADTILGDFKGRGGAFFTPPEVASCLSALLDPKPMESTYDPFCGSGELLSAIASHVGRQNDATENLDLSGQTPQEWSWLISTMNLTLHGVTADLRVGSALDRDEFDGRQFDVIISNPPFNLRLAPQHYREWSFGEPPAHNANYAWLQDAVAKLKPGGRAAVIMPSGAASTRNPRERAIRRRMVEAGVVQCVIALPAQLFKFTAVPTTVWVLRASKRPGLGTLFIDARGLSEPVGRTGRRLADDGLARIVDEYRCWQKITDPAALFGSDGFSKSASLEEIREQDYLLMPARYVEQSFERATPEYAATRLASLQDQLNELSTRAEIARCAFQERLGTLGSWHSTPRDGRFVSLGSVCEVLAGPGKVLREPAGTDGVPLVLPRNISESQVQAEHVDVVAMSTAERMGRYRLDSGDIVGIRTGTIGRHGLVNEAQKGWLLGPGCIRFRAHNQVDPRYLVHYLNNSRAQHWLIQNATGSVIQHLNTATANRMPLWLPDKETQHAIVAVLDPVETTASLHSRISEVAGEIRDLVTPMLTAPGGWLPSEPPAPAMD
jgi:type I restriction enzyme M protein